MWHPSFDSKLHTIEEWDDMERLLWTAEKYGFNAPVFGTDEEKWDYYYRSLNTPLDAYEDEEVIQAIQENIEEARATGN